MDYDSDHEEPFHGFIPESFNIEIGSLPPPINAGLCQPTSPKPRRMSDDINTQWKLESILSDDFSQNFLHEFSDEEEAREPISLPDQVLNQEEIDGGLLLPPMFLPTASVLKRRGNCKFNKSIYFNSLYELYLTSIVKTLKAAEWELMVVICHFLYIRFND